MGEGDMTETFYKTRQSAVYGGAGLTGTATALQDVSYTLSTQQEELSSGDWIRIGIAGLIVGLTIAGLIWTWRK